MSTPLDSLSDNFMKKNVLQIFLEIEQDEDILHDDLADFIEDESTVLKPSQDKDHQTEGEGNCCHMLTLAMLNKLRCHTHFKSSANQIS